RGAEGDEAISVTRSCASEERLLRGVYPWARRRRDPGARNDNGRRRCAAALRRPLLPLPAAADLLLLALVLHLGDRAEHLEAELAVRLAVDLHGALVLDDVAGGGIDHDMAARAVGRPA